MSIDFLGARTERLEAGFNRLNEALASHPHAVHPVTQALGSPLPALRLQRRTAWIREMQNYKWKRARGTVLRNAPDEPVDYNDHSIDESRYLFARW